MEIIYKDRRKVNFEMVAIGDVFSYDDAIYMRTQEATSTHTGELYNAVHMIDGESTYFDDNEIVIQVKAQLIIS